jgi:hypothetical protein
MSNGAFHAQVRPARGRLPLGPTMSVITTASGKPLITGGLTATVDGAIATVASAVEFAGISPSCQRRTDPGARVCRADHHLLRTGPGARTARRPHTAFVRTTVVLTALSVVPNVLADASPARKVLLMSTHLVTAAIVIPAVTPPPVH